MSHPAIKIINLKKSFDTQQALKGITVDIAKGEIFGFIGPDGAGKTTLFRILTSLLVPDEGKTEILGYDSVKDFKIIRSFIGYMPGKFSLYQDLSVIENLRFFATVFGTTIEKNYDLVKDIYQQIEPFKNRLAGKLSGGMKQKLALSCALIHKPEILILDEPTTGVDAVSRKEFWDMLFALREKGLTILVSTPYMDEAERCNRVALIQEGKILTIDSPIGIRNKFERKVYEIHADNLYPVIKILRKYEHTWSVHPFGQFIHYIDKRNTIEKNEIKQFIKKSNNDVSIREITPEIEDCFMYYMSN